MAGRWILKLAGNGSSKYTNQCSKLRETPMVYKIQIDENEGKSPWELPGQQLQLNLLTRECLPLKHPQNLFESKKNQFSKYGKRKTRGRN